MKVEFVTLWERGPVFWTGFGRFVDSGNTTILDAFVWGWDDDVPWSWMPSIYQKTQHETSGDGIADDPEIIVKTWIWTTWLGFSVGHMEISKWKVRDD